MTRVKKGPVWEIFRERQQPPDAGMTIIEVLEQGATMNDTWYLVRMHCCRRTQELSHFQIRNRQHNKRTKKGGEHGCLKCQGAHLPKRIGTRMTVTWPVPPMVLADKRPFVWLGDAGGNRV